MEEKIKIKISLESLLDSCSTVPENVKIRVIPDISNNYKIFIECLDNLDIKEYYVDSNKNHRRDVLKNEYIVDFRLIDLIY